MTARVHHPTAAGSTRRALRWATAVALVVAACRSADDEDDSDDDDAPDGGTKLPRQHDWPAA